MKFEISNKISGVILGIYDGKNKLDAYQNMMREAGYSPSNLFGADDEEPQPWDEIPEEMDVIFVDEENI